MAAPILEDYIISGSGNPNVGYSAVVPTSVGQFYKDVQNSQDVKFYKCTSLTPGESVPYRWERCAMEMYYD